MQLLKQSLTPEMLAAFSDDEDRRIALSQPHSSRQISRKLKERAEDAAGNRRARRRANAIARRHREEAS